MKFQPKRNNKKRPTYRLKGGITPYDFLASSTSDDGLKYFYNESKGYLTKSEWEKFRNDPELYLNAEITDKDNQYTSEFHKIKFPIECIEEIHFEKNKLEFSFEECGEYLIYACEDYIGMNLFINEAIHEGYSIMSTDIQACVVEMTKMPHFKLK